MAPVSDEHFSRALDRITALEQHMAVREEMMRGIDKRLGAIELILSRLTWLIASTVVGSVLAMVVY